MRGSYNWLLPKKSTLPDWWVLCAISTLCQVPLKEFSPPRLSRGQANYISVIAKLADDRIIKGIKSKFNSSTR